MIAKSVTPRKVPSEALLLQIATRHFHSIETQETRNSDGFAFHDVAVWSIRAALEAAMTKLTETQTIILSAGAQRPDNIALPLPRGLAGAAAKMAVTKMIERGWLQEVDANLRREEPLWWSPRRACWPSGSSR